MRKGLLSLLFTVVLIAVGAFIMYQKNADLGEDDAADATQADGFDPTEAKVGAYVDCFNQASRDITRFGNLYPFDQSAESMDGPIEISELGDGMREACSTGLDDAAALDAEPIAGLDSAAADFRAAVDALLPAADAATTYFEQGNHQDDGFAAGATHASTIQGLLATYSAAEQAFSAQLDVVEDQRNTEQLAEIEAEQGRGLEWNQLQLMIQAKAYIELVEAAGDQTQLTAAGDELAATAATVSELWDAADREQYPVAKGWWDRFVDAADDYVVAAKETAREQATPDEAAAVLDALYGAYNDLVQASNLL